jgi:hypothetical protein
VRLAGAANTDKNSDDSTSPAAVTECAAMFRASSRESAALRFLHFVAQTPGAELAMADTERPQVMDALVESLIADLLGATLVDARDELEAAWMALEQAGEPEKALQWMTEPPSWPPVSVARYLSREGQTAMSLVDTLAQELAPDPGARAWLVRSWISPSRPVDDTLLAEIAHAADGRLGREPRFRAWLNAEWTASARQRFRRVARMAVESGSALANTRP